MKTKLLLALWACCVLVSTAKAAEENKSLSDTIVIRPDSNVKIIFIGYSIDEMTKFQRIDTLKEMLIGDVQKAKLQAGYPESPKTTHYFVSEDGRRRVKAESADFLEQGIDVDKESRSMNLGLPPYAFIIHDLVSGNEVQIYLADPSQLSSLSDYKLSDAIRTIKDEKKIQRHSFRVDLERSGTEWMVHQTHRRRNDMIEIVPFFGFGLIGNQWSPAAGGGLWLTLSDKYGIQEVKFGASYLVYTFPTGSYLDFSDINVVQSYDADIMFNLRDIHSPTEKNRWFGVSAGKIQTSLTSTIDDRWKFGILTDAIGPFNCRFETILMKDKKAVYSFTMLVPF